MSYDGNIELISGIKQANNGSFALADASAIRVDDDLRLDTEITNLEGLAAAPYDNATTYNIGDYCIYNHTLWSCQRNNTTGQTPSENNTTYWVSVRIMEEAGTSTVAVQPTQPTNAKASLWIDTDDTGGTEVPELSDITDTYAPTGKSYKVGDYVSYGDATHNVDIYKCKVEIAAPAGDFDFTKWETAVLGNDISDLNSALNNLIQEINDLKQTLN